MTLARNSNNIKQDRYLMRKALTINISLGNSNKRTILVGVDVQSNEYNTQKVILA